MKSTISSFALDFIYSEVNSPFLPNKTEQDFKTVNKQGRGQTTNFSQDEPNLVSQLHEKFDVWLSYVRLNEFGSSNTFYPSASDG